MKPLKSVGDIIRGQVRGKLGAALERRNEAILSTLESGALIDDVPAELMMLYRPSVQPYLISWLRYQPSAELQRLSIPVLIAQGSADIQIDTGEAVALHAAHGGSTLAIIDGMNHVLKIAARDGRDAMASYCDPGLPVASGLIDVIAEFLHRVPGPPVQRHHSG